MVEPQSQSLVSELAAVLRTRHRSNLDQLELPELRRLADRLGSPVPELILESIERIEDPRTRHAARELVPMPFGSRIAPTLTDRRISAARSFGQSGNYFRSGPSDRSKPSTESLVLAAIATALSVDAECPDGLVSAASVTRGPIESRPLPEVPAERLVQGRSAQAAGRDRGAVLLLLLLTVSLALAGSVVWKMVNQIDEETAAGTGSPSDAQRRNKCRRALGTGSRFLRTRFRDALDEAQAGQGCPIEDVDGFEGMSFQRVAGESAGVSWVVLERPDGRFLAFPWTAWERYRIVAEAGLGFDGFGLPSSWRSAPDLVELSLDGGLTIASEDPHGLYFLVHPKVDRLWHDHVDVLGAPFSSAMTTSRQEFAGGYVEMTGTKVTWMTVPDGSAKEALPSRSERVEAIVEQSSGVRWWVDSADRRWSIRSDGVEECLGGQAAVVEEAVPGYAIAQLEFAGVADCSLAPG